MSAHPSRLSWVDVAPARDPKTAALTLDDVAKVALPAVPPHGLPDRRHELDVELKIDALFRHRFGAWASGWRWSMGEGSLGGGPVTGWCCPSHSIWISSDRGPLETAHRAAAGLLSWRDWIRELADLFARTEPALPPVEALERRALEVVERVAQRTGAEDAWYAHAHQVLSWFLEDLGHPDPDKAVARALRGRFESWCSPPPSELRDVALTLRDEILRRRPGHVDALDVWWRSRRETAWATAGALRPQATASADGLLEHTVRHDAAIDEDRGTRMFDALAMVREQARAGAPLTVEALTGWQRLVLGPDADVSLRKHHAWAKEGRERYGVDRLAQRVEESLAGAVDERLDPVAKAARVYLDLCFLHPFVDGNARAARLALDFVLTQAGLTLRDPEGSAFRLPLPAVDPKVGTHFQSLLNQLVFRREQ